MQNYFPLLEKKYNQAQLDMVGLTKMFNETDEQLKITKNEITNLKTELEENKEKLEFNEQEQKIWNLISGGDLSFPRLEEVLFVSNEEIPEETIKQLDKIIQEFDELIAGDHNENKLEILFNKQKEILKKNLKDWSKFRGVFKQIFNVLVLFYEWFSWSVFQQSFQKKKLEQVKTLKVEMLELQTKYDMEVRSKEELSIELNKEKSWWDKWINSREGEKKFNTDFVYDYDENHPITQQILATFKTNYFGTSLGFNVFKRDKIVRDVHKNGRHFFKIFYEYYKNK